jgi:hypothetical protein
MPRVELVYDGDCPNVAEARAQLLRAFAAAGAEPRWREWRGDAADAPPHVRGYGSPTILVDGRDVAESAERGRAERGSVEPGGMPPAAEHAAPCCRLYRRPDGTVAGVPSVETIVSALRARRADGAPQAATGGWTLGLATLPGIGAAILPKVACPACWPAYAGFASAVGLGFLLDTTYLLPLTVAFLALAAGALAFRASRRRGYGPFVVGLAGAAIVLVGKFSYESDPGMYAGLALLVAASIWNGWPRRQEAIACPACVAGDPSTHHHQPRRSA